MNPKLFLTFLFFSLAEFLSFAGAGAEDFHRKINNLLTHQARFEIDLQDACKSKIKVDLIDFAHSRAELKEFEDRSFEQISVLITEICKSCMASQQNQIQVKELKTIHIRRGGFGERKMRTPVGGTLIYYAARNKSEYSLNTSDFINSDLKRHLKLDSARNSNPAFAPTNRESSFSESDLTAFPESEFVCHYSICDMPYDKNGILNGTESCFDSETETGGGRKKIREVSWQSNSRNGKAKCFANDKIRTEASFKNNLLHGPMIEFGANSLGDRVLNYVNGKQIGFEFFLKEGKVSSLGACYRDGKEDPSAKSECEKVNYGGFQEMMKGVLLNEKKRESDHAAEKTASQNGPQVEKDKDGNVIASFTTAQGKIVGLYKRFYSDGKIQRETEYSDSGEKNGEDREFNKDGILSAKSIFQADVLIAKTKLRMNGKPDFTEVFSGDRMNRKTCRTDFFNDGAQSRYGCHFSGSNRRAQDGPSLEWFPSGQPAIEGQYQHGLRAGKWKYFNESGQVRREAIYEEGKMKSETVVIPPNKIIREFYPDGSIKKESKIQDGKI